jgi:hypothetical protein
MKKEIETMKFSWKTAKRVGVYLLVAAAFLEAYFSEPTTVIYQIYYMTEGIFLILGAILLYISSR